MNGVLPVDTQRSLFATLKGVDGSKVRISGFLSEYFRRTASVTLPTMYELLEKTGRLDNLRFASGKKKGTFQGYRFNDTDVYKWAEAVSYLLAVEKNEELERYLHTAIQEIRAAQDEDGYLDSYYPKERKNERWTDLAWSHEMYCAGHLIQAAVAHKRATGSDSLFEVARRFADHIESLFGPGKRQELDGHPEVEMALVELYRETGDKKYLELADYFVRARGKGNVKSKQYIGVTPEYFIDHKPFAQVEELVGHAVRMLYLCCGAADVYLETGAKDLWSALERLWHDLTTKKMYITGACGARSEWEAFGKGYELPNKRAYAETCASIANFMWNYRMFLATGEGKYVDVMEQVLYNGLLSGISLDGKHYFYDNPLESDGTHCRREWFECACCPPNIARLITSLPAYIYSVKKDDSALYINLYENSDLNLELPSGKMSLLVHTEYPWSPQIHIEVVRSQLAQPISILLRIPVWAPDFSVRLNGKTIDLEPRNGYVELNKTWVRGDMIDLDLSMPIDLIQSHPFAEEIRGKVAIKRGPIVYCAEAADNDFEVRTLSLSAKSALNAQFSDFDTLAKAVIITGEGLAQEMSAWEGKLYSPLRQLKVQNKKVEFKLIPYCYWANRMPGPMVVWMKLLES